MKNALFRACDSCARPLDGKVGTAQVKEDYIQITGCIDFRTWDEDYNRRMNVYATSAVNEQLDFCSTACLNDFIDIKVKMFLERQRGYLQREAQDKFNDN